MTPNQESWKHIQQVAQEIRQQTGLQTVVTLGSSPQPTLVYVPGIHEGVFDATQTIAPIGWVEERWIHIGVELTYLNQLGSTRLLLLGTVLAVCLGFLAVAFSALVSSQRREFAILTVLGWRPWQPLRLFLAQAVILAIGGGVIGLSLALLIVKFLEAIPGYNPWRTCSPVDLEQVTRDPVHSSHSLGGTGRGASVGACCHFRCHSRLASIEPYASR
jgi:FtsX-like permease family